MFEIPQRKGGGQLGGEAPGSGDGGRTTKFTVAWKQKSWRRKLAPTVSGYSELYDFTSGNYHNSNKRQADQEAN